MEHLIFIAGHPEEVRYAANASTLISNWADSEELIGFVKPMTPWLGFDHDTVPFGDFETYPERCGYHKKHLWNAYLGVCHDSFETLTNLEQGRRVATLLQSWLFLGFMECVVGKKINASYLTRQHVDGRTYIYTRNLHFCLQVKVFDIRSEPDLALEKGRTMKNTTRAMNKWISRFMHWSHPSFRPILEEVFPGFMELIEDFIPVIIRLGEVVDQARLFALRDHPLATSMGTINWSLPFNCQEARKMRLKSLGWCPFQIQFAELTLNHSTLDWMCAVNFSQNEVGHEKCTKKACARSDIDNKTYKQSHCCQSGRCDKLRLDLDEIKLIIDRGEYPILSMETMEIEAGMVKLTTKAYSSAKPTDYIALSHVWADGIGGEGEYGLNKCQVERVDRLCRSYNPEGNGWFWLDSLCIPSKKVGQDTYIKALVAIRDVYLNATTVLVLDRRIEECCQSTPTENLYAHIYMSAWMQRMWTYEEAVLAKNLVFVLRDGFHTYKPGTWPSMRRTVSIVWQSLAAQLYRLRARHRLNIGHIYRAFRFRLTNVRGEEFLSVSGMLNLDTSSLINVKGDERAKRFWLMLGEVPDDIPFLIGPKLADTGFRWAPQTMMYPSPTAIDTELGGPTSRCTPNGLMGRYLTIELDRNLRGSAGDAGSIFYVLVNGALHEENMQHTWQETALLRIYCVESWPESPEADDFDMLYLPIGTGDIMSQGQWVPGAVAMKTQGVIPDSNSSRCIKHVNRVLIERLRVGEMTHRNATIMYEGADGLIVNAKGVSNIEEICIV